MRSQSFWAGQGWAGLAEQYRIGCFGARKVGTDPDLGALVRAGGRRRRSGSWPPAACACWSTCCATRSSRATPRQAHGVVWLLLVSLLVVLQRLLVYLLHGLLFTRDTQASCAVMIVINCEAQTQRRTSRCVQQAAERLLSASASSLLSPSLTPFVPPPHPTPQAALERWVGGTARIPLLGWLSGRAAEILVGVQRYYTYVERMAS